MTSIGVAVKKKPFVMEYEKSRVVHVRYARCLEMWYASLDILSCPSIQQMWCQ